METDEEESAAHYPWAENLQSGVENILLCVLRCQEERLCVKKIGEG